jgi:hypothetical protein
MGVSRDLGELSCRRLKGGEWLGLQRERRIRTKEFDCEGQFEISRNIYIWCCCKIFVRSRSTWQELDAFPLPVLPNPSFQGVLVDSEPQPHRSSDLS